MMQAETDMKVSQNELEYSQQQLKVKQQNLGGETTSYAQDKAQLENLEKEIKNLKVIFPKSFQTYGYTCNVLEYDK